MVEEEQTPEEKSRADASAALPDMARKYKRYLEKLKEGKPSGITGEFRKASDILNDQFIEPELIIEEDEDRKTIVSGTTINRELQPGDSLFSNESARQAFSDKMKEALKVMKAVEVPAENTPGENNIPDKTDEQNEEDLLDEEDVPGTMQTKTEAEPQLMTVDIDTESGEWLWSAVLLSDSHALRYARFADGSTIIPAMTGNYLVHVYPADTNEDPAVEVLGSAVIDIFTGNIYYRDASDTHAVALLNNGWRLDQFITESGEEENYAMAPADPENGSTNRLAVRVNDLNLDVESGTVTFFDADNGTEFHLNSRRLPQDNA